MTKSCFIVSVFRESFPWPPHISAAGPSPPPRCQPPHNALGLLFLVSGQPWADIEGGVVGEWQKLVATPHGRCVWLLLLLLLLFLFFYSAAHKVLKSFILRLFCRTRAPLSESERRMPPSDQLTWPESHFPLSPPASKNPICQHFNNHCRRALQKLILWPSTFNCLPKQIIFE